MTADAGRMGAGPDEAPVGGTDDLVPGWLRRFAAIGWRLLVVVALLFVLVQVAIVMWTVTASIIVAVIITATVLPVLERYRARGWAPTKAAAAASGVALAGVLVIATFVLLGFVPSIVALLRELQAGTQAVQAQLLALGVPQSLIDAFGTITGGVTGWVTTALAAIVAPIAGAVTVLILGGFLMFFLLADGERAWRDAVGKLPEGRASDLTQRGGVAIQRVGLYMRTTVVLASIDGAATWAFLLLLGIPVAGPLAVVVFFASFAPYLGVVLSTALIALVAFASGGVEAALAVVLFTLVLSFLESRYIAARMTKGSLRLNPAFVIVAVPAGAAIAGLMGVFVAVPVAAVVQVVGPGVVAALDMRDVTRTDGRMVPVWLDRMAQWSWRILVAFGVGWVVLQAFIAVPGVTLPVLIAVVLGATMAPAVRSLVARGTDPTVAALAVTVGSLIVVFGTIALVIASLVASLPELTSTSETGANQLQLGDSPGRLVQAISGGIGTTVVTAVEGLGAAAVLFLLGIMLTFFFLRDGSRTWGAFLTHVPTSRRAALGSAGSASVSILSRYIVGTSIISIFGAVTQALIMWLLGLPLILPVAVLAFFCGFIPYIGGFITTGLAFLIAVAVGDTRDIVIMFVFTIVFNIAQGNFVQPIVYSKTVSIHPAIVLMGVPAGGAVAGILGMFLVVPVIGVISATWRTLLHLFDPDDITGAGQPELPGEPPDPAGEPAGEPVPAPTG